MPVRTFLIIALCWCSAPAFAIVNGLKVNTDTFRSYASVRATSPFPSHNGQEINACGGSLVAPNWVLTALHCWPAYEAAISGDETIFVGVNLLPNGEFAAKMLDKGVRVVGARWSEKPEWTRICIGLDHEIEKCHAAAKDILTSI